MLLIFKSGAYGLHLFDRIIDFSGFSYFFMDFSGCFAVVRGAVLWISAVSATFLEIFPAVSLGLGSCFRNFSGFSYFFQNFSSFWAGLGSCFRSFMDYSYPSPACYQPMAMYIMLI